MSRPATIADLRRVLEAMRPREQHREHVYFVHIDAALATLPTEEAPPAYTQCPCGCLGALGLCRAQAPLPAEEPQGCAGFDCAGLDGGQGPQPSPHASTRCGEYDHNCTCGAPYSAHQQPTAAPNPAGDTGDGDLVHTYWLMRLTEGRTLGFYCSEHQLIGSGSCPNCRALHTGAGKSCGGDGEVGVRDPVDLTSNGSLPFPVASPVPPLDMPERPKMPGCTLLNGAAYHASDVRDLHTEALAIHDALREALAELERCKAVSDTSAALPEIEPTVWRYRNGNGSTFVSELDPRGEPFPPERVTPFVPEAAVKGCKHKNGHTTPGGFSDWCSDCGALGVYALSGRVRWQRPRILRVSK